MNMAERFPDDGHGDDEARAVHALVQALNAEACSLDPRIAARLGRARREALAHRRNPAIVTRVGFGRSWLALAGTAAGVALAAILVATPVATPPAGDVVGPPSVVDPVAFEGAPVLSGAEDMEFYESIDFLLWLESRRA